MADVWGHYAAPIFVRCAGGCARPIDQRLRLGASCSRRQWKSDRVLLGPFKGRQFERCAAGVFQGLHVRRRSTYRHDVQHRLPRQHDSTQGTCGTECNSNPGDCTGQGYFHFTPSYDRQTRIIGGFVFRWRDQFFYVPKTTISEPRTFLSERSELDGSCLSVNVEDARTLPVFDNDELTTGVKASYPAPITIAVRSTLATQFEDGFESV
jgi:hypothetical protein